MRRIHLLLGCGLITVSVYSATDRRRGPQGTTYIAYQNPQWGHQTSDGILQHLRTKTGIEPVQALGDISRSGYVVTATKPVHLLQIRPIVHN